MKDVEYLSSDSLKGRKTGTPENRIAASFVAARFKKLGLKAYTPNYLQPFSFKNRNGEEIQGVNVVGYIPGKKKDVLVISAHFDHVGVINGEIFNGADDNASGTAGLLSLAAYFAKNKPNNTLVFAAFDAEEMGLQGSKAFVASPPVSLENIKADINMDMISHNEKGELYVSGTFQTPGFKEYLPTSFGTLKLIAGHDDPKQGVNDWTNQSDQGSFNKKGIPFLYFGVEDHKDYHRATDEYKTINKPFFIDAVEVIRQVVKKMDEKI
ncbi:aminopeptidase [Segetibacter aerophilus]|uniref:Aminopeptidase n=1 Tax=Segetibacter aerophilus TaxID=670293 RepID=A0A512B715_9BACT|nr:aminopeptidase [Segetibacter aerophilus]